MGDENSMILNLDDHSARIRLMQHIGTLRGLHEVSIKKRRATRSLDQNRYYFAAVVEPWKQWMREASGDPAIDCEQAHYTLVEAVLGRKTAVNQETGEVVEYLPRTRTKKTDEFSEYIEAAAKFLAEFAGIVVLPADLFFEGKE
jgi:hypothetical protein